MSLRPTRRRTVLVGAAVAAGALLAACSGTAASDESGGGEPVYGGTLEVGFSEDIENYDPHQRPQLTARTISRQIADTLTDQDPETGEILPWLAESWEINEDSTAFTFHLREDVTFSDGTPLDAEAVAANFDRIVEIGPLAYIGAGLLRNYDGAEADDEYTVTVRFTEPNAQFLQATAVQSLSILAPATLELDPEEVAAGEVIGSGPFVLESYDPNEGIALTAREDYAWGSPLYENRGRAHVDEIHVSFIPEPTTLAGAVASGQVDYGYVLAASTVPTLEAAGAQVITTQMPAIAIPVVPLLHQEIVQDAEVRRALSLATDRQAIVDTVFEGRVSPATGVLSTTNPGYVDLSAELRYDLDGAITLLESAGWDQIGSDGIRTNTDGDRLSLEIQYVSGSGDTELMLQLLQQQWAEAGIEFVLTPVTAAESSEYTIHNSPADVTTWSQTRADPDVLRTVYSSFYENQSFLFGHADPDVDQLLDELQRTIDQQDRLAISEQVQQLLLERGYTVPIYDRVQFAGAAEGVTGVHTDLEGKPLFVDFSLG
ncbi:MAG TPA: ABC transporter substrate-binding protein [Candidatus Ruania gallistercoris]|uniref:ABC transporter substrate-binding protein n=1 Tax=Candidatus Ruania gallistercoris TaxID=2838746 RepID=A0A9D2EGP1_9MICO|nr:ABC transporter substrate-binding protein [Candidatus Ruania gallistercoris]